MRDYYNKSVKEFRKNKDMEINEVVEEVGEPRKGKNLVNTLYIIQFPDEVE